MSLQFDRSIIGEEFDRWVCDPITAEELIAFARALGETNPRYVEAGPDLVAHPTYCVRFHGRKFFPDNLPQELRTRMSFDAGKDLEFGVPVRPGDTITVVSTLHDVYEKTGRTGSMYFVVVRSALTNAQGELVANVDNRFMYKGFQLMAARPFDDVFEGDELPTHEHFLAKDQVRAYARAVGMIAGRFMDDEQAKAEGLPGMITPGNMSLGLIAAVLEQWAGDGSLRRLGTTFRGLVLPDRTIRICGAVTERNDDTRAVEIDCWIESDEGERLVIGTATVALG